MWSSPAEPLQIRIFLRSHLRFRSASSNRGRWELAQVRAKQLAAQRKDRQKVLQASLIWHTPSLDVASRMSTILINSPKRWYRIMPVPGDSTNSKFPVATARRSTRSRTHNATHTFTMMYTSFRWVTASRSFQCFWISFWGVPQRNKMLQKVYLKHTNAYHEFFSLELRTHPTRHRTFASLYASPLCRSLSDHLAVAWNQLGPSLAGYGDRMATKLEKRHHALIMARPNSTTLTAECWSVKGGWAIPAM